MIKPHLRQGTEDQGSLVIGHQNPQIVRLSDGVPVNQVIRRNPVHKDGKFIRVFSSQPQFFPFFDKGLDFFRISPFVTPVRLLHRGTNKGDGGQLLRLINASHDLSLNFSRHLNGNALKV